VKWLKTEIIEKGEETYLVLNDRFYPRDVVDKAVDDFQESCDIIRSKEGAVLKGSKESRKKISLEFFNYMLALRKNEDR
jgi:hypothetical protein